MSPEEILRLRISDLKSIIRRNIPQQTNRHVLAFTLRILVEDVDELLQYDMSFSDTVSDDELNYCGYPCVAALGFSIGANKVAILNGETKFIETLLRIRERSKSSLLSLKQDDLALLGIADGLSRIQETTNSIDVSLREWLITLIDTPVTKNWSFRMRDLAGDLLDGRGRVKVALGSQEVYAMALEAVLHITWQNQYQQTGIRIDQPQVLKQLLMDTDTLDYDKAVVGLQAIRLLLDFASNEIIPTVSDTVRILKNTQHALKRWVWEEKPKTRNRPTAKWLIDNEYHVQSFLWSILYPIYGEDLVDETYLPNWGNTQPRADLGIQKLKLIIEVKIVRSPRDFKKVEAEVGDDVGLYFKDTDMYDRMIVFIYDDCDPAQPEKHDALRHALLGREQVEDVVIISRPSMIPKRDSRNN